MNYKLYVRFVFKIVLLLGVFGASACTVMPNETKIINVADQKWRITALAVYQVKTGWLLRGKLSSPNSFGLPLGHILISIIDTQGVVIESKEISYQKVTGGAGWPRRDQFGTALFSTYLKSIPKNAVVVAEFKIVESHVD